MNRMIYLGNDAPKEYLPGAMGDEPALAGIQTAFATQTVVSVSPDSTIVQAVAEIKTIWSIHSHEAVPVSIGCSEDMVMLANVLCAEFGNVPFSGVQS